MTEEDWRHIAQTILENQYIMLQYIEAHAEGMDFEDREMLQKMMRRTEIDITLRL